MDPQQGYPQPDLIVGQTIGNYLVTQKLGEGGMGAVYLAEHPSIGKKVALKVLHAEFSTNEEVAARFFNEAKAVNNIGHPNIVDIVDYGIIQAGAGREQLVYFIMEYLSGITLSQLIQNEAPLPPERALSIALQVGDALSASHRCGIVHRDLKPDNIMLQHRGRERDFVKLLDFGIAKLTTAAAGSRRTRTGIVMGTPAYMSPEQCDGRGNIDHRTDIYALGIVLYEMLVGRVPFTGEGYGEVLVQHLTQPPVAPSQYHLINPHVEAVVMKALEKRPSHRYPSMDEMMRAMSDPIGYVESHGGIASFAQQQLVPSNAPVTISLRLTPTPPPPAVPTPAPGALSSPLAYNPTPPPPYMPTPPPGHYHAAASAPTTLGSAASASLGDLRPARSKLPRLIVAALVVATVTVVAIVFATREKNSAGDGPGSERGSGSSEQIASGSDLGSGTKAHGSAANPGSAVVIGSAGSAGSASHAAGSDLNDHPGSGSGSAGSGSAVESPKVATITLTTTPPGAKIIVNGLELDQVTPQPFDYPQSTKEIKITLRLDGYKDIHLDKIVPNQNINLDRTFVKKQGPVVQTFVGRGSSTARGSGSSARGSAAKGSGSAGSATIRSGSNGPKGSNAPGSNDTGLMKPGD